MAKGNKLIDDHVQVSLNLARFKKFGKTFEIAIDPDKAVAYKEGTATPVEEIVQALHIFTDVKKGLFAPENDLKEVFGTTNPEEVIKAILDKGEIQFNQKYRDQLRERKFNKIVHIIHANAVDPRTGIPHPEIRIRSAMEEAKVRVDPLKRADDQIETVLKVLRPILPISFEQAELQIHVPPQFSAQVRGRIVSKAKILFEDWLNDGSLVLKVELPAGLKNDFLDELNNITHGGCDVSEVKGLR